MNVSVKMKGKASWTTKPVSWLPGVLHHTPWGTPQQAVEIGTGIWSVSTAGHGGFYVTPDMAKQMPGEFRGLNRYGGSAMGGGQWFEEDCEWAMVAVSFPVLFTREELQAANRTLSSYYKETTTRADLKMYKVVTPSGGDNRGGYYGHSTDATNYALD